MLRELIDLFLDSAPKRIMQIRESAQQPTNLAFHAHALKSMSLNMGAQKIVDHLIEVHGCRRIAFLRGPDGNEDSSQRERGYRKSLKSHGLAFDSALIGAGGFNDEDGQAALSALDRTGSAT